MEENQMADEWHYSSQGDRHGPVSAAELKRLADAGQLSPADLVWKEGLANWVAASSVKGLFARPAGPPPLPTGGSPSVDFKPKAEAAVKATAEVAKAAVQSIRDSKPIAGFHIQRAAFGVAAILGALTTFMPWASAPIVGTIYGTAGDGWFTLILFIPAIVIAALGDRQLPIEGWKRFAVSIPAGVASIIGVWKITSFYSQMSRMRAEAAGNPFGEAIANMASVSTRVRFGLYLLVLTGIAVAAAVFVLKGKSQEAVDL